MKYKRIIQVPSKVVQSVFDLPCVDGYTKDSDLGMYVDLYKVFDKDFIPVHLAWPGDYLAEDESGRWICLTSEEGEQYLRDNNIVTLKSSNP